MSKNLIISDEAVISKIHYIRGRKVMLDKDLAELYGVKNKRLKEQVKRNSDIFPEHFMFELTSEEFQNLRSQIATSRWGGQRYLPYAFTEHGVLQLANVLRSKRARRMSVRIIEVFIKMSEMLQTHKDILQKLEQLEKKFTKHDDEIQMLFAALKELLNPPNPPRKPVGFKRSNES